ncbi:RidA family protein, partial [candidate division KSB1 bacterium]|nr:RidA family protein [candidate division KSB1 bacterium]
SIFVSGTTATNEAGEIVGVGDMYAQTKQTLINIQTALERLGASMSDVVRTRLYVTDVSLFDQVAKAHGEFFAEIRPASSLVEVNKLVDSEMLVEIEAQAVIEVE